MNVLFKLFNFTKIFSYTEFWEHLFYITLPMTGLAFVKRALLCSSICFHICSIVGSQKVPQKLKGVSPSSSLLVTCVYFKVHTSHSNFQICWGMKILLRSVNTDQTWILIISTNSNITVTNQFHLCNGSFSWTFQLQVKT